MTVLEFEFLKNQDLTQDEANDSDYLSDLLENSEDYGYGPVKNVEQVIKDFQAFYIVKV